MDSQLELVRRAGAGDREAMAEFARQVAPAMHGALLRMTGSSVAAGVLLEEALATLWVQAPLMDDYLGRPVEWAMFVAREVGRAHEDQRRGARKERPHLDTSLPTDRLGKGPRAEAFAFLPEAQQELLREAWLGPLPGGASGQARRAAFGDALRAWVGVLTERGLLPALPREG